MIPVCVFFHFLIGCNTDNGNNNSTDIPSSINITLPASGIVTPNGNPPRVEGDISDIEGPSTVRVETLNRTTTRSVTSEAVQPEI